MTIKEARQALESYIHVWAAASTSERLREGGVTLTKKLNDYEQACRNEANQLRNENELFRSFINIL